MATYTGEVLKDGVVVGSAPIEVTTGQPSPRIVNNGTANPSIAWDLVPGATSYKTYWPGDSPSPYRNHSSTTTSWTISPTFPGETRTIGWTYFDGVDHWISPELSVTFSGTPPPPPPPPTASLKIGLVPGGDEASGRAGAQTLGMRVTRSHDKSVNSSVDSIEAVVRANGDRGLKTILLMGDSAPGTIGLSAEWARQLGPGGTRNLPVPLYAIEWGNEDSFSYKNTSATAYANSARNAYNAIHAANPNVIFVCQLDEANRGPFWIDTILSVWPASRTADGLAWSVHPYGPPSNGRLTRNVDNARARGLTGSIFITEDGMATDNGRTLSDNYGWPTNQTYAQAAVAIDQKVAHVASFPEVKIYLVYQFKDQRASGTSSEREHYFGIYQSNGTTTKGPYTDKVRFLVDAYNQVP